MRIYLKLSPNKETVPFSYMPILVGAFHKWLGENELHDGLSLYSLSWLSRGKVIKSGFDFKQGSTFFISAPDEKLLSALIKGILKGQEIRWGMEVQEVIIQRTPEFGSRNIFAVQSPVLIKRQIVTKGDTQYYYHNNAESGNYLTETLALKMKRFGIDGEVKAAFDTSYSSPIIKKTEYKGIGIKGSLCPVIIEGDPRAVQFAWEVGVGNSTGIGFGALM